MATVSIYLNFQKNTEEIFRFYQSVFGTEFIDGILHYGDMPPVDNRPPIPETVKPMVMHIALPLPGGTVLMGSDAPEMMGYSIIQGNNVRITLDPDSRAEADRLFKALSEGGSVIMALVDTFWGAYHGSLTDQYGIHWMINCTAK